MTDKLSPPSTHIVAPSQIALPPPNPAPVQDGGHKQETVEEEPYTIKCICTFSDDDGNTIYCEKCDTWQHIECYYPDNTEEALREDFSHFCVDCKPRPLDRHKAFEKQKARLAMPMVEEQTSAQKPKRPPSKSHKKKPKPTDLHLNGHTSSVGGGGSGGEHVKHNSSHEHPHPSKKAKISHKATHSVSSQAPKRSPSYGNSKTNNAQPPSPANTPPELPNDFEIHSYSPGFVSLHSEGDVQDIPANSFANTEVVTKMSRWPQNPELMRNETGEEFKDVFQPLPDNLQSRKRPLDVETKEVQLGPETAVRWRYLTAPAAIEKDAPLMELIGQIGFQKDYCADPTNRWEEFTCPLPFVFFHPMLPLYIDTRREGSQARYVRRSCKPNAVLDTFLSEENNQYHFWLMSDRPIAAKEQITIPWDFRLPKKQSARMLRILGLSEEEPSGQPEPESEDLDYRTLAGWIHLVLSEYGGCACGLGGECAFARFHRNYLARLPPAAAPKKKSRKPKPHTISPTSTGHATNSRAASEGHVDDAADHDRRSVSDSSRSKPPSRDMTPARQPSLDAAVILDQPTERDKRKVAMAEEQFRQLETQLPPRKKKRTSDGTTSSKPRSIIRNSTSQGSGLPNGTSERRYVDAGTSRSKSGSPAHMASPRLGSIALKGGSSLQYSAAATVRPLSASARSTYRDAECQTDPVDGEWYSDRDMTPKPKKRVVSLSKRLLNNRHRLRMDDAERRKRSSLTSESSLPDAMDVDSASPEQKAPELLSPTQNGHQEQSVPAVDTPMTDAPSTSPTLMKAIPGLPADSPVKSHSPELRVQMPPVPTFGTSSSAATTPLSATGSIVQSPFAANNLTSPFAPPSVNGVAANPSPVKKKLTLSDYTKNRMSKAAAAKPTVGTTSLKPASSNADEPKSATSTDIAMGAESPTAEKASEPSLPPAVASTSS